MKKPIKKIVVLTSGGDAPGMNAALRAAVRTALHYNIEVYGAELGFAGLAAHQLTLMDARSVANCIQRGGTILKTKRFLEFHQKPVRDKVREYLAQLQVDALVVIGGNGSFRGATLLEEEGGPAVIGIPCTIDNDINGTEYCIGFDTACNTALQAIDKIRDTAFSLERNFIIEVMGRSSGFIAAHVGMAGGAEIITTPEFPISVNELIAKIKQQHSKKMASIIVVAEADQPGHSIALAETIKEMTGIDYRVCILGHTQRGGTPTVQDRFIGSLMGAKAITALREGQTQQMTAVIAGKVAMAPMPDVKNPTRFFHDEELLRINQILCEI